MHPAGKCIWKRTDYSHIICPAGYSGYLDPEYREQSNGKLVVFSLTAWDIGPREKYVIKKNE